jgi:hypothetical protein
VQLTTTQFLCLTRLDLFPCLAAVEQRAKDLDDALNWMRNKGKDDDANYPTGDFHKVDNLLPKKRGQPPEDRGREIEGALAWMRNNSSRHAEWEMERDTLLKVIQKDCNASFQRLRSSSSSSSSNNSNRSRPSTNHQPIADSANNIIVNIYRITTSKSVFVWLELGKS